jgi:hypothetical protein
LYFSLAASEITTSALVFSSLTSQVVVVSSVTSQPNTISSLAAHVVALVSSFFVVDEDELDDEDDLPPELQVDFALNVAVTVTFLAGIVNLSSVTVITLLSASLTVQLQKV